MNPYGGLDIVKMNPGSNMRNQLIKPAGPTDPEINFIALKKLDNTPLAILANYSLHYAGGIEKNTLSADYFGVFDNEINKLLNNNKPNSNFIGIMSNGTSGDINSNNYNRIQPSTTEPNYEKMTMIAKEIAEDVAKEYQQLVFKNWIPLQVKYEEIPLKKRNTNSKINSNLNKITANKNNNKVFHLEEKYYATRINYYNKNYPTNIYIPLQTIQLGDLVINTVPFEVFAETGLGLKNKSLYPSSFTIGIANGHWGYLPTVEQHKLGGYETWITVSRVKENSSRTITKKLLNMQKQMKSN